MKLQILLGVLGLAGITIARPIDEIEADYTSMDVQEYAEKLYKKHCTDEADGIFDLVYDGTVLCVKPNVAQGMHNREMKGTINLPETASPPPITIFVEQPKTFIRHKVTVKGDRAPAPKTTIYVRPGSRTHEYDLEEDLTKKSPDEAERPTLFFLKEKP